MNTDDCWLYAGELTKLGYGRIVIRIDGKQRGFGAHRVMYENLVGEIPEGLVCDHLCRVPQCINPAHIDIVTNKINILRGMGFAGINARKTHCKNGHELTEGNLTLEKTGWRRCKICKYEYNSKRYHAKPYYPGKYVEQNRKQKERAKLRLNGINTI